MSTTRFLISMGPRQRNTALKSIEVRNQRIRDREAARGNKSFAVQVGDPLASLFVKQVMQIAAFLMRTQEGDGDFAAGADLAF